MLWLPSDNELLLRPALARSAHGQLLEADKQSELVTLEGATGHLNEWP